LRFPQLTVSTRAPRLSAAANNAARRASAVSIIRALLACRFECRPIRCNGTRRRAQRESSPLSAKGTSRNESPDTEPTRQAAARASWSRVLLRVIVWAFGLAAASVLSVLILVGIAVAVAYPNVPEIGGLSDYRPKLPMRIYAADGLLLGEFGEERRNFTPIAQIPKVLKDAVLAAEDARFYEHSGVDYKGIARAALANLRDARSQGGSTITMQVAKNFYLPTEKTYTRKIYELLLTWKIEKLLTKEQILELYMNQIFLGQRAHGFAAASDIYFGKPVKDLSIAEAAMLAALPVAPSVYNPIVNPSEPCCASNSS
jgi:penicillin-binding protein 1A